MSLFYLYTNNSIFFIYFFVEFIGFLNFVTADIFANVSHQECRPTAATATTMKKSANGKFKLHLCCTSSLFSHSS